MNVLMNCLSARSGGAISYLTNLAPALAQLFDRPELHHHIMFLAHEEQKPLLAQIPPRQCIFVNGFQPDPWPRLWWERRHIPRIVREKKYDVLFTPYQIHMPVPSIKQVAMFRNLEPFLFHRYPYSPRGWLRNRIIKYQTARSLRQVDRVIAVSDYTRQYLTERLQIPAQNISRIYHGRGPGFVPRNGQERDNHVLRKYNLTGPYILTCGSLLPYRRCEDVIAAFDRWCQKTGRDTKLIIAGAGTDARYGGLIRNTLGSINSPNQIVALGHVLHDAMQVLYRHCLMCVIATEIEACPNIAIEAMASGCAIISTDRRPLPEILDVCSLEYRARDIDDLTEKMERLAEDESLHSDLKNRALKRAQSFCWNKCARQTYSALVNWPER